MPLLYMCLLGDLTTKTYFLSVLEVGKPKIKVPDDLVPGKDSLPSLKSVASSLCPHMVERENFGVSSFFFFFLIRAPALLD